MTEDNPASYLVPAGRGEAKYTEKMSRFLAFAVPVRDAAEAKEFVKSLDNKYHDARHVCWAYMIGPDRSEWQLNDNGEPSGTAGKPILGQINSAGLTDIAVAVVRYFGGIKLGTSGLIAAYREAARLAIEDAGVKTLYQMVTAALTFPYLAMNGVMKVIKQSDCEVMHQSFDNSCEMTIRVRKDLSDQILGRLEGLDGVIVKKTDGDYL